MANAKKPLDEGFKRTLKIVGGAVGVGLLAVGYLSYSSSTKTPAAAPGQANIGDLVMVGGAQNAQLSAATREKLDRVQQLEAQKANREGRTYVPEVIFGEAQPINAQPAPPAEQAPVIRAPNPDAPPRNRYANNELRQSVEDEQKKAQLDAIRDGLLAQMQMMANGMRPATMVPVQITMAPAPSQAGLQSAASDAGMDSLLAGGEPSASDALVGGDEIVAAVITTPIDTDRSRFAMAQIVGGKLNGAQLRGQVVPMSGSGDIEDVGLRFTSMRLNGQFYQIDAIALNEQTASDALDGSVDRRLFTRYAMPIMMAGLSGLSTYFTSMGTPAISTAQGTGAGAEAVIVDQERASREDAKNQGIGQAIDAGVQSGNNVVNKLASRPNKVTLEANTPIGIIFNQPVWRQAGQ